MEFSQHTLDILKYAVRTRLPGEYMASTMTLESHLDHELDRLVLELRANVMGRQLPTLTRTEARVITFETPASWWQHLKATYAHLPVIGALIALRPPRMRTEVRTVRLEVDMRRAALFPESSLLPAHANLGAPVLIYTAGPARWWEAGEADTATTPRGH